MSNAVIKVENLGKKYIIGHQKQEKYTALRDVISNGINSLLKFNSQKRDTQEEFWALKDVSFEINQGDRVGIIGRNGAGKSTLLKILSRITEPTKGQIKIKGRVASLLEVGTGFHPELTGRENIFLNGAILGMSQVEIKKKFDEIVTFAEVEKFLDTPVKRYSSGMYVRLAFAVAAHLEPEILVVDEVLAVGDAQFQKKCLGKMEDVGKEGRTVLFVSHQIGSIAQLCDKAILLDKGIIVEKGKVDKVIELYIRSLAVKESNLFTSSNSNKTKNKAYIEKAYTVDDLNNSVSEFSHTELISLVAKVVLNQSIDNLVLGIELKDIRERKIFTSQCNISAKNYTVNQNVINLKMEIPKNLITPGQYYFLLALHIPNLEIIDQINEACRFTVVDTGSRFSMYEGLDYGCVFADCRWQINNVPAIF